MGDTTDDDLLLKQFFAEVSEVERDNEVLRILSCFKLNPFEFLILPFDSSLEDVKNNTESYPCWFTLMNANILKPRTHLEHWPKLNNYFWIHKKGIIFFPKLMKQKRNFYFRGRSS